MVVSWSDTTAKIEWSRGCWPAAQPQWTSSVRAASFATWVADDGSRALITDLSLGPYQTYLVKAGTSPVRLGTGQPASLSPNGSWALAVPVDGYPLMLHPTGPGESRTLPDPEHIVFNNAGWLDAGRVVGFGQKTGERSQGFIQDISGGPPRRFTPEGATVNVRTWWALPISVDGTRVVATDEHDAVMIYPVNGGTPQPVPNLKPGDVVVQWASDGLGLLVAHRDGLSCARRQLLLPVSDNYFCRRRVSKGSAAGDRSGTR